MSLVKDHNAILDVNSKLLANDGVDDVVIRAEHNLGSLCDLTSCEKGTSSSSLSEFNQIFEVPDRATAMRLQVSMRHKLSNLQEMSMLYPAYVTYSMEMTATTPFVLPHFLKEALTSFVFGSIFQLAQFSTLL